MDSEFEEEWEILAGFEEGIGLDELTKEMELTSRGKRADDSHETANPAFLVRRESFRSIQAQARV